MSDEEARKYLREYFSPQAVEKRQMEAMKKYAKNRKARAAYKEKNATKAVDRRIAQKEATSEKVHERNSTEAVDKRIAERADAAKNIETGARGGRYYLSDNGQKVYVK